MIVLYPIRETTAAYSNDCGLVTSGQIVNRL